MYFISFLSLYFLVGVACFTYVVDALDLNGLNKKKGTPEAYNHIRELFAREDLFRVRFAYLLALIFFPAMILAELVYEYDE